MAFDSGDISENNSHNEPQTNGESDRSIAIDSRVRYLRLRKQDLQGQLFGQISSLRDCVIWLY